MKNKTKCINTARFLCLFLAAILFFGGMLSGFFFLKASGEESTAEVRNLLNGSFEEGQTWTSAYLQPDQSKVPSWNTTAFQGKIELFRSNTGTYINNVKLVPTDGTYAAELNADEESTLYQNIKTSPSSVYEWGLDHGGRNGTDTMALIIGPKQSYDPSKPSKAGRDQMMQMVDWLMERGSVSIKTSAGLGEHIILYSKKFGAKGTFEDNAGNNAFSLTPSSIYTERWEIWIMASSRSTSGTNRWNSYGSNDTSVSAGGSGNGLNTNHYYLYSVPAKQTDTVFAFVSVGYVDSIAPADKAKTYGNFIDNINFRIYHPFSGSTTNHGSAVIGGSDGSSGGEGSSAGHEVTVNNKFTTYVSDGETLKIQAVIKAQDVADGCRFVGVYNTYMNKNGVHVFDFIGLSGNQIDDTGSLTEEEKKGKWVRSVNEAGDIIYTYSLENITSSTDLHFIFIKSPTVTYDSNGGKPYIIENRPHQDEDENVYSFRPTSESKDEYIFVPPYVSKAAEGQNDGWKFMGWKLTGDIMDNIPEDTVQVNADKLGSLLLPAEHSVACDYDLDGASGETAAQYFKIYDGNVSFTQNIQKDNIGEILGTTWDDGGAEKAYANIHHGLTMVAQWRWRQAFIPQTVSGGDCVDSAEGGTVEITSVTDQTDENYNDAYTEKGGKSYHSGVDETINVKATPNAGWKFIGWYDASGKLVSTNAEYGYVETTEAVNTYYARFANGITQTYIRQFKNGDNWEDITDDTIGVLDRYSYTDAVGMPISCTADAGKGYKFVGWYDSYGQKVADDMVINNGTTISYTTTDDATYYARYEKAYTLNVSKIDEDADASGNKIPLAGAEFTLYQMDENGDKTITYDGASVKCITVGSATTALTKDGKEALAAFTDLLLVGRDYYLVETKPPFGYNITKNITRISFTGTEADENGILTIEIANQIGIRLPMAGGAGTFIFNVIGVMLIGAAVFFIVSKKNFAAKESK